MGRRARTSILRLVVAVLWALVIAAAGVLILLATETWNQTTWVQAVQIASGLATVVAALVAALALSVTVVAARQQQETQRLTASLEQLNSFDAIWDGADMRRRRGHAARALRIDRDKYAADSEPILNFFEKLGLFVSEGGISERPCWGIFADAAQGWWGLLEAQIAAESEEENQTYFEGYRALIQGFARIDRERGIHRNETVVQTRLEDFLEAEAAADQLSE
jgi:hypothetical protein